MKVSQLIAALAALDKSDCEVIVDWEYPAKITDVTFDPDTKSAVIELNDEDEDDEDEDDEIELTL